MAENVTSNRPQFVQYAPATGDDHTDLQADPSRQGEAKRGAGVHHGGGAVDLVQHQRFPSFACVGLHDLLLRDTESVHFVQRKVDPAFSVVDGHILNEIDELQAGADLVRARQQCGRCSVEQVQ